MKLVIGYDDNNLKVEAESVVQAILKILDLNPGTDNMEFEVKKVKDNRNN